MTPTLGYGPYRYSYNLAPWFNELPLNPTPGMTWMERAEKDIQNASALGSMRMPATTSTVTSPTGRTSGCTGFGGIILPHKAATVPAQNVMNKAIEYPSTLNFQTPVKDLHIQLLPTENREHLALQSYMIPTLQNNPWLEAYYMSLKIGSQPPYVIEEKKPTELLPTRLPVLPNFHASTWHATLFRRIYLEPDEKDIIYKTLGDSLAQMTKEHPRGELGRIDVSGPVWSGNMWTLGDCGLRRVCEDLQSLTISTILEQDAARHRQWGHWSSSSSSSVEPMDRDGNMIANNRALGNRIMEACQLTPNLHITMW
jgi:hypothetical protein